MSEPVDLDKIEKETKEQFDLCVAMHHPNEKHSDFNVCIPSKWILGLIQELREAREKIYDLTKCWACDEGYEGETCTCTEERKGIISKLKEELREARREIEKLKTIVSGCITYSKS